MNFEDDIDGQNETSDAPETGDSVDGAAEGQGRDPKRSALVTKIQRNIKDDKQHHKRAFDRMRRDMHVAMTGAEKTWSDDNYRANIAGRHVKQKTAALYAKNPKATALRSDTIDFALWDENPATLQLAFQTIQAATVALQQAEAAGPQIDAATGAIVPAQPQVPPGFEQAQALIADFQQGYARRQQIEKIGKTLEILFAYFMREQKPVSFKTGMKQAVRRAATTGVGYVELGFQRETGPRPGLTEQLADARQRLDHLRVLAEQLAGGELDDTSAEVAELEASVSALMNEPEIVMREGLIVDFPQSTKVIPDKLCKSLEGFVGARHLTVEYTYTLQEVQEIFQKDISKSFSAYTTSSGSSRQYGPNDVMDDDYEWKPIDDKRDSLVCVWKYYDKPSGLVYWVADGHDEFLREPAPPEVFVEDFWPVYALTFNAVESEEQLFPLSDVALMIDMQREHNRSRQGKREHRDAARPRWVAPVGIFGSEEDTNILRDLKPFEVALLNIDPQAKISDILQQVPTPGVDPNLYDTNEVFADTQLVVGAQEAQFGGVSKATATESAIAANSTTASDGSSIDDLDGFLSLVARASGQIMLKEMSEEQVKKIAGVGAVWPQASLAEIAAEVQLEVAAGSTGKPNQAIEINNWKQMLPMLLQMPAVEPTWLAKETLRRLDDKLDLTSAIAAGMPSIVAQNGQQAALANANPSAAPEQQGAEGMSNAPAPPGGGGGSEAAFGSNQVANPL